MMWVLSYDWIKARGARREELAWRVLCECGKEFYQSTNAKIEVDESRSNKEFIYLELIDREVICPACKKAYSHDALREEWSQIYRSAGLSVSR